MSPLSFREGRAADLQPTFEFGEAAWDASRRERGLLSEGQVRGPGEIQEDWKRERSVIEFLAATPGGRFLVCDDADSDELLGFALVPRFDSMDELAYLWVALDHDEQQDVRRGLLERAWPESPTPEDGRVVMAVGMPADLTLYTEFGVMPVAGHWQMRHRLDQYLEERAHEVDATEPDVHALTPDRAVEEWMRLEPDALGHERRELHEFFARTRNCLATIDPDSGRANAVCWVSGHADIGPAVGEHAEDLVPVVLAALDRVAKMQEPDLLAVHCTTASWWLMDRLRRLGFWVHWPAWIMSSVPLPGLDRYVPTRPVRVL